jgi:hypothetical protein
MADLIIKFERIGRSGTTPADRLTLTIPAEHAGDPDKVAHLVFRHARRNLVSSEFGVTVDLDAGTVSLEGGRYGRGTIAKAEAKS